MAGSNAQSSKLLSHCPGCRSATATHRFGTQDTPPGALSRQTSIVRLWQIDTGAVRRAAEHRRKDVEGPTKCETSTYQLASSASCLRGEMPIHLLKMCIKEGLTVQPCASITSRLLRNQQGESGLTESAGAHSLLVQTPPVPFAPTTRTLPEPPAVGDSKF